MYWSIFEGSACIKPQNSITATKLANLYAYIWGIHNTLLNVEGLGEVPDPQDLTAGPLH